tara:strand:+ start:442 stop:750 length:309 start_codon:yes stop_codon:yes gene_type:complete
MALNKTFKNQDGVAHNGYYRVREVGTQYEKSKDGPVSLAATFTVEVYDYDSGEPIEDTATWRPEGGGIYNLILPDMEPVQNLITKAYEHLKTLPEFSEATDC